ncbi:TPA: hypothetical protein I8Z55_000354 [Legionella pneumophila]|nr:hypothetical protein [Legionella pneumophila]
MECIFSGVETLDAKEKGLIPDLNDKDNPWGSKYNESMCLEIINMFSEGKTRSEFCARHTISNNTFEAWKKKHPLFNRACEVAHEKARAYFDRLRDSHLEQEIDLETKSMTGLNHALFNRMYNARFNIPDKRLVTVKALGRAKDERAMLKSIMNAVSNGELTPDEAQKLANLIDVSLKVTQIKELEERLKAIEQAQKIGVDEEGFEEVPD